MGNANETVRGRADKQDRLAEHGAATVATKEAAKEAARIAEREAAEEARIACAEHLSRDFARVRARFGMDHALARQSLDAAWTTDVIAEEDEAEFVDTLADCMGAGLSLETALTSWDTGTLAADESDDDDELAPPLVLAIARAGRTGRRVYVR